MKFWITMTISVVLLTALATSVYLVHPELIQPKRSSASKTAAISEDSPIFAYSSNEETRKDLPQSFKDKTEFEVSNKGKSNLEIYVMRPNCVCVGVTLVRQNPAGETESLAIEAEPPPSKDFKVTTKGPKDRLFILEPQAKGKLIVYWDTKEREGTFNVNAPLGTNDPLKKAVDFKVHLEIKRDVMLDPPVVNFSVINEGKKTTQTAFVYSQVHPELKVTAIGAATSKSIAAKIFPMTNEELNAHSAKSGSRLEISLDGAIPIGSFFGRLTYKTNLSRFPEGEINMGGEVMGQMAMSPRAVDFSAVPSGVVEIRKVFITAKGLKGNEKLIVGKFEPALPNLSAELIQDKKIAVSWTLIIKARGEGTGPFAANLAINDSANQTRLNLPIRGLFVNAR